VVTDETTAVARSEQDRAVAEVGSLAREMGRAYRERVEHLRKEMSVEKADAWAGDGGAQLAALEQTPPDQLDWWVLGRAAELDAERARAAWERTLAAARDELVGGHRAARAVQATGSPWERAQFLAILESFERDWQPRGGIEGTLVETLAQAYTAQLGWLARLTVLSNTEAQRQDREIEERGRWAPPTLEDAAAIDQAAAMVDRFNRLFMRTLRSLRDLRRYGASVVVQNVGQFNLGQAQVNIVPTESPAGGTRAVAGGVPRRHHATEQDRSAER